MWWYLRLFWWRLHEMRHFLKILSEHLFSCGFPASLWNFLSDSPFAKWISEEGTAGVMHHMEANRETWMNPPSVLVLGHQMDFQKLLLEAGNALCKDEVKALAFLCTDLLGRNLASVESASDLFAPLANQDHLSAERPHLLTELLLAIHRPRLVRDLRLSEQVSTTSSLISPYRCAAYCCLTNVLVWRDLVQRNEKQSGVSGFDTSFVHMLFLAWGSLSRCQSKATRAAPSWKIYRGCLCPGQLLIASCY